MKRSTQSEARAACYQEAADHLAQHWTDDAAELAEVERTIDHLQRWANKWFRIAQNNRDFEADLAIPKGE